MAMTISCLRCHGTMEEGYLLEITRVAAEQQLWVKGAPMPSGGWGAGLETSGTARYKVATWRCANCGYLESRATERS